MSIVITTDSGAKICPHCYTNQIGFKTTRELGMTYMWWCYKCNIPLFSDFPKRIGGNANAIQASKKEET